LLKKQSEIITVFFVSQILKSRCCENKYLCCAILRHFTLISLLTLFLEIAQDYRAIKAFPSTLSSDLRCFKIIVRHVFSGLS